jgi:hypothetical protein
MRRTAISGSMPRDLRGNAGRPGRCSRASIPQDAEARSHGVSAGQDCYPERFAPRRGSHSTWHPGHLCQSAIQSHATAAIESVLAAITLNPASSRPPYATPRGMGNVQATIIDGPFGHCKHGGFQTERTRQPPCAAFASHRSIAFGQRAAHPRTTGGPSRGRRLRARSKKTGSIRNKRSALSFTVRRLHPNRKALDGIEHAVIVQRAALSFSSNTLEQLCEIMRITQSTIRVLKRAGEILDGDINAMKKYQARFERIHPRQAG